VLNGVRSPVVATDSGGIDFEGIREYVESLKRRAQESNRVGGSNTSFISRRLELWMLPVPVRFSFHVVLTIGN
jgi:hypothetical protein